MAVIFFKSYFWNLTFAYFFWNFTLVLHTLTAILNSNLISFILIPNCLKSVSNYSVFSYDLNSLLVLSGLTTLNPIYWCARFVNPSLVNFKYTFLDHKEILWFQLCCKCLSNKLVSFSLINVTYSSLPLLHFHTWMCIKSLLLGLMT